MTTTDDTTTHETPRIADVGTIAHDDPMLEAWLANRPDQTLERAVAAGATPSEFDHYEKLEHTRPPPPGVPFGYILEVTTCVCAGCGTKTHTARMFAVMRAGYGAATMGLGAASPIFDRPIKRVNKTIGTPVCLSCIEDYRPHPVHYPVPRAAIGRTRQMAEADGGSTSRRPAAPTRAADVVDDFT